LAAIAKPKFFLQEARLCKVTMQPIGTLGISALCGYEPDVRDISNLLPEPGRALTTVGRFSISTRQPVAAFLDRFGSIYQFVVAADFVVTRPCRAQCLGKSCSLRVVEVAQPAASARHPHACDGFLELVRGEVALSAQRLAPGCNGVEDADSILAPLELCFRCVVTTILAPVPPALVSKACAGPPTRSFRLSLHAFIPDRQAFGAPLFGFSLMHLAATPSALMLSAAILAITSVWSTRQEASCVITRLQRPFVFGS
jgi:hypothetical protein